MKNLSKISRFIFILALSSAGGLFLLVKTDREFINLAPSAGAAHGVELRSYSTYEQSFVATRSTITRLGLFFMPTIADLPDATITVAIKRADKVINEQSLSAAFLDGENFSQIRFYPPLAVTDGEQLTVNISVPPALDNTLRLQQRQPDATFSTANVSLAVDGEVQNAPAAYQVFYGWRPSLAVQIGGLLILAALLLIIPNLPLYVLGTTALFIVPALLLKNFPLIDFFYAALALSGMLMLLREHKLPLMPALFGAHVFAFTTWLPLHALASREYYAAFALLPILISSRRRQLLPVIILAVFLIIFFSHWAPLTSFPDQVADFRDIFFDPNQVPDSQKVPGYTWDHFGSYIGIISAALSLLGLIWQGRRHKLIVLIGLAGALLALTPFLTKTLARFLPLPPSHFIILTTFAVAYFAAFGLYGLRHYLQPIRHVKDPVVQTVIVLLVIIALLDLWQVAANTLEYGLL